MGVGLAGGESVGLEGRWRWRLRAQLLDYRPPCCRPWNQGQARRGACCENSNGARKRTGCRPWRIRATQFGASVGPLAT